MPRRRGKSGEHKWFLGGAGTSSKYRCESKRGENTRVFIGFGNKEVLVGSIPGIRVAVSHVGELW